MYFFNQVFNSIRKMIVLIYNASVYVQVWFPNIIIQLSNVNLRTIRNGLVMFSEIVLGVQFYLETLSMLFHLFLTFNDQIRIIFETTSNILFTLSQITLQTRACLETMWNMVILISHMIQVLRHN